MKKTLPKTETEKISGIKSWPEDDRPREKLLKKGARSLSNSELLAILLRTGRPGESAVGLARKILEKFGSFRNMAYTDIRQWQEFKGLGKAKIAHIQAALEIGRRFYEEDALPDKKKISSPDDIARVLMPRMRDLKVEVFNLVCLNSQNRIIGIEEITRGTVNQAMPIVREIIHSALQKFAAGIVCAHNHPSGDVKPSNQDKHFTSELLKASEIMDIRFLDHIIIGDGDYFSFANEGLLQN